MTAGRTKALGLVSGGLDSQLAVALLKRQGLDLVGLHIYNGFSPALLRREIREGSSAERMLDELGAGLTTILGIPVEIVDVSREFLDILASPRHGYGANVNPCIDCRIFMLQRAKERMERIGARFVFTGEVLGQRPMSQRRQMMELVERHSGLEGLLLRPLSAKLFPPTIPEERGWVSREELLDIQGRSRQRQMQLARELGLEHYAQPAGGCTLTDENYARRFRDLMGHRDHPAIRRDEALLLAVGRHFRLSEGVKVIVGRDEAENGFLERTAGDAWLAAAAEAPGATVLVQGEPDTHELRRAAEIAARYSDAKESPTVRVELERGARRLTLEVTPAALEEIDPLRI